MTLTFCAAFVASCVSGVPKAEIDFKGEQMTRIEQHRAVHPCEEHILAPARVLLEVAIDASGQPLAARVTAQGGTVRDAFANCVRTRLLAYKYDSRGEPVTVGAYVDLRVGAFSNAGSPTPTPHGY